MVAKQSHRVVAGRALREGRHRVPHPHQRDIECIPDREPVRQTKRLVIVWLDMLSRNPELAERQEVQWTSSGKTRRTRCRPATGNEPRTKRYEPERCSVGRTAPPTYDCHPHLGTRSRSASSMSPLDPDCGSTDETATRAGGRRRRHDAPNAVQGGTPHLRRQPPFPHAKGALHRPSTTSRCSRRSSTKRSRPRQGVR